MSVENEVKVETVTVDSVYEQVVEGHKRLAELHKEQQKLITELGKQIKKERKTASKEKKVKREIKQVPQKVTPEMQKFIKSHFKEELNAESMYTRQHLMRLLSNFIKSQDIQNPKNKKEWSGKEKTLKKLFNLNQEWYTFMQINGILSSIIVKA